MNPTTRRLSTALAAASLLTAGALTAAGIAAASGATLYTTTHTTHYGSTFNASQTKNINWTRVTFSRNPNGTYNIRFNVPQTSPVAAGYYADYGFPLMKSNGTMAERITIFRYPGTRPDTRQIYHYTYTGNGGPGSAGHISSTACANTGTLSITAHQVAWNNIPASCIPHGTYGVKPLTEYLILKPKYGQFPIQSQYIATYYTTLKV